jgi:pseudouridine synthase
LGQKARLGVDAILVDGRPLAAGQEKVCYLLNKPAGVVTTLDDPQGRPSVRLYVAGLPWRLFPVGRLDRDSEGLLLLTNDGPLANRLMHPRYHVPKTYVATLDGPADGTLLAGLRSGVELADGVLTCLAARALPRAADGSDRVELTIAEGRKRVVRRALQALGRRTLRLQRVALGPLALGDLAPGAMRRLTTDELQLLEQAIDRAEAQADADAKVSRRGEGVPRRAAQSS